jgi:ribosomal protein S18 acetylase RimI-like enzyme
LKSIREARLTDVSELARLHRATFSGSMGASLGQNYLEHFFRWYVSNREATNLVCELDGTLAGYVFGAPDGHGSGSVRRLLLPIARGLVTHPGVLAHPRFLKSLPSRLRALAGRAYALPPAASSGGHPAYALVGIGVGPRARGLGVARELLAAYEERVFDKGFSEIVLHVYPENARARQVYESSGWRCLDYDAEFLTYVKIPAAVS